MVWYVQFQESRERVFVLINVPKTGVFNYYICLMCLKVFSILKSKMCDLYNLKTNVKIYQTLMFHKKSKHTILHANHE